jgi:hypothetical protein
MSEGLQRVLKKHGIALPERSSVGDGWLPLIDELVTNLKALGWDCKLSCVKEKFGGLRFYTNSLQFDFKTGKSMPTAQSNLTKEMGLLIGDAEQRSLTICEECGAPGVPVSLSGWAATRCNAHGRKAE